MKGKLIFVKLFLRVPFHCGPTIRRMIDDHSPSSEDCTLSRDWRDLDITVSRDSRTGIRWCLSLSTLSSLLCQYTEEILATHCSWIKGKLSSNLCTLINVCGAVWKWELGAGKWGLQRIGHSLDGAVKVLCFH